MSIRVVLDASALLGYVDVDRALAVGELIRMVREETIDDHVGIPATAFVAAYTTADEEGRTLLADVAADVHLAKLHKDIRQSAFVILSLSDLDVSQVSDLETRSPGCGHALIEALRHGATLATFGPSPEDVGVEVMDLGASWDDTGDWEIS